MRPGEFACPNAAIEIHTLTEEDNDERDEEISREKRVDISTEIHSCV